MLKKANSKIQNAKEAIEDILQQLDLEGAKPKLSMFFISSNFDFNIIATRLKEVAGDIIACSTSGVFCAKSGSVGDSIVAISFCGDDFESKSIGLKKLDEFPTSEDFDSFSNLMSNIEEGESNQIKSSNRFAILLVDGLSIKEEVICGFLANYLNDIPLIGASAGDNLEFLETFVYVDGEFKKNAATVTVLSTVLPFKVFKHQHFKESSKKLVITNADPEKRIVYDIDGEAAGLAYAKILGLEVKDLCPDTFSKFPLMLKVGEENYVRSIQKVNEDLSLTFYCAIENGLVLTIAEKENMLESNNRCFDALEDEVGEITDTLLFECILRRLEINSFDANDKSKINKFYENRKCLGFYTYGEQFGSVHINQTLTGVVFGKK
jgi:hypothetical protein